MPTDKRRKPCPVPFFLLFSVAAPCCWVFQKLTDMAEKFFVCLGFFFFCFCNMLFPKGATLFYDPVERKRAGSQRGHIFLMEVEAFCRITAQDSLLRMRHWGSEKPPSYKKKPKLTYQDFCVEFTTHQYSRQQHHCGFVASDSLHVRQPPALPMPRAISALWLERGVIL